MENNAIKCSKQLQPLTSTCKRIAGIVPVNGLFGIDAICLYALNSLGPTIEPGDMHELGDFLNRYIAEASASGGERGGDLGDDLTVHVDAPIDWYLGNFTRYVKEHNIGQEELELMINISIEVRSIMRAYKESVTE